MSNGHLALNGGSNSSKGKSAAAASAQPLPLTKKETTAGDSDSDEDNFEEKLPRELLSPVPRNQLTTIVVFGADGNLAEKKLLPMLYELWLRRLLPRDVLIFGYARPKGAGGRLRDTGDFRFFLLELLNASEKSKDDNHPAEFVTRCHYVAGQFGDADASMALLTAIEAEERKRLKTRSHGLRWMKRALSKRNGNNANSDASAAEESGSGGATADASPSAVRMYYMSVPPFLYAQICEALCEARAQLGKVPKRSSPPGSPQSCSTPEERFVLEKPFGRDHSSCASLMSQLSMLKKAETFYIDHYLGKELVMNLLVLRFANVCFGGVWNRTYIKSVQVIFKEKVGTEGRAGYFDQYGIIRDVMQNHLLQMVALVAMEQPLSFTAEHIREEKLKVLNACRPLALDDLVTGQYAGYLDDDGIADKGSCTETFAAAVLRVHNPRWDGVPFVLKAGKALNDSKVELRVQFHPVPGVVSDLDKCVANELVVLVQPEPAIYWKVQNKVPGLKFEVEQVRMDLLYAKSYLEAYMPGAYERLVLEALVGDHSHFVSEDELDAQWRIFTPVLHALKEKKVKPEVYAFGGRGPAGQDRLARRHGMSKFGGGLTPYVMIGELAKAAEELQAESKPKGERTSRTE